jgi:hypothetical protein
MAFVWSNIEILVLLVLQPVQEYQQQQVIQVIQDNQHAHGIANCGTLLEGEGDDEEATKKWSIKEIGKRVTSMMGTRIERKTRNIIKIQTRQQFISSYYPHIYKNSHFAFCPRIFALVPS